MSRQVTKSNRAGQNKGKRYPMILNVAVKHHAITRTRNTSPERKCSVGKTRPPEALHKKKQRISTGCSPSGDIQKHYLIKAQTTHQRLQNTNKKNQQVSKTCKLLIRSNSVGQTSFILNRLPFFNFKNVLQVVLTQKCTNYDPSFTPALAHGQACLNN